MTETLQAALLGVVQGLSEFLPISSSAHLVLVPWLVGWTAPLLNSLTFDVALHLGTLGAVLVYFRREWWAIARAFLRWPSARSAEDGRLRRLGALLIVGSVPAAIAGVLVAEAAETTLRHPLLTAAMLVGVGLLMWLAEVRYGSDHHPRRQLSQLTLRDALLVGTAQATALIPGVSRSGITIVAGLTGGCTRETAARFSFLLGTPVIAGAGLLKAATLLDGGLDPRDLMTFAVGILAAGAVGYAAIAILLAYVRRHPLYVFVVYRLGLALLIGLAWVLGRPWPWPHV